MLFPDLGIVCLNKSVGFLMQLHIFTVLNKNAKKIIFIFLE